MTPADILAQREVAGRRYAAAVTELRAALVELAALDKLAPKSSGPGSGLPFTFAAWVPENLPDLRHRTFCPNPPTRLKAAVLQRVADLREQGT